MKEAFTKSYKPLLVLAVLVRIAILVIPGNSVRTPWSGGGDMNAYVLLAHNLVSGDGYTYAHQPSAFRTPGYPLFLATTIELFGDHFAIAARSLQVLAGFLAAYFCMKASRIFFGQESAKAALLAALWFPTLVYFSGEILTEALTSFFLALFLWLLAEDTVRPDWKTAAAMGLVVGFGSLVRANLAILGLVALMAAWISRPVAKMRLQLAIIPICAGLVFGPWIVRNWLVFGSPLISTERGAAALVSVVNPEARPMPGWDKQMRQMIGYVVPNQLETNGPERLAIGSEIEMNQQCWRKARELLSKMSWDDLARWTLVKWETYWLSTDQLIQPGRISKLNRALHLGAVVFYWALLALAGCGWWELRKTRAPIAAVLLGYAVLVTLLHTPFVMNSRIRTPLVDPLIAVLAGGGFGMLFNTGTRQMNRIEPLPLDVR
jgi:4-amino-4-deoxy-L-arabinose transferase-like glycosyltransferase